SPCSSAVSLGLVAGDQVKVGDLGNAAGSPLIQDGEMIRPGAKKSRAPARREGRHRRTAAGNRAGVGLSARIGVEPVRECGAYGSRTRPNPVSQSCFAGLSRSAASRNFARIVAALSLG